MGRKARVCVVDDNKASAAVLAQGLRMHDYDATEYYSGAAALEGCADGNVDLVLLDISMPEMDGFEVCERLKANPKTRDVPVIFVTARGEPAAIKKGLSLGATDYITKPFNLPMVLVRVESVLQDNASKTPSYLEHAGFLDSVYTDQVTGLRNQRYLMQRLQEEVDKAYRYHFPVSCVVFDIEDIQPTTSEAAAVELDELLPQVAMVMRCHSRTYDILARFDETLFAALLPHTPLEHGIGYCEKIIEECDYTTFSDPVAPTRATLTAAVVTSSNSEERSAEFIFGEAMRTLLIAKSTPSRRVIGKSLGSD